MIKKFMSIGPGKITVWVFLESLSICKIMVMLWHPDKEDSLLRWNQKSFSAKQNRININGVQIQYIVISFM